MFSKIITLVAIVALSVVLVNSNSYGPTYNDAHEQAEYQPQMSYQQESSYGGSSSYQQAPQYSPPAYKPSYQKYSAPSSAHHTQYDNYYPKQTYSQPMYQPAHKPYSPPPMYKQQPSYMAPKPMYSAPSYGGSQYESADYRARA